MKYFFKLKRLELHAHTDTAGKFIMAVDHTKNGSQPHEEDGAACFVVQVAQHLETVLVKTVGFVHDDEFDVVSLDGRCRFICYLKDGIPAVLLLQAVHNHLGERKWRGARLHLDFNRNRQCRMGVWCQVVEVVLCGNSLARPRQPGYDGHRRLPPLGVGKKADDPFAPLDIGRLDWLLPLGQVIFCKFCGHCSASFPLSLSCSAGHSRMEGRSTRRMGQPVLSNRWRNTSKLSSLRRSASSTMMSLRSLRSIPAATSAAIVLPITGSPMITPIVGELLSESVRSRMNALLRLTFVA